MATTKTSFKPGQGGRKKGIPNKATGSLRNWVTDFINGNRKQIQKDWKGLDPKDRIIMFERLLKFALPTLQATNLEIDGDNKNDVPPTIIIHQIMSAIPILESENFDDELINSD